MNIPTIEVHKHDPESQSTNQFRKILAYGESGVGKTVFASTFPNPIFLDVDGGLSSVQTTVDYIRIESWGDLRKAFINLAYGEHSYQTVILDSLNSIQDLAMYNTVDNFPQIKRPYGDVPSESDYRKLLYDFDKVINSFCKLADPMEKMHVVMTAFSTTRVFETDFVQPKLVGKASAQKVCQKMDIVGWMNREEVEAGILLPVIHFNERIHISKDRTWKLPPAIIAPTFEKLNSFWRK